MVVVDVVAVLAPGSSGEKVYKFFQLDLISSHTILLFGKYRYSKCTRNYV